MKRLDRPRGAIGPIDPGDLGDSGPQPDLPASAPTARSSIARGADLPAPQADALGGMRSATDTNELLRFPCEFPIKVMGPAEVGFAETIAALVCLHCPDFDPASLVQRPSRAGRYLGLTATIQAISREQLDGLYRALSSHPMVRVVL